MEKNGFCLDTGINSIEEGDQGGPAIYNYNRRQYLGGIASFDLSNGLPSKYVRIHGFVNWLLRDHSRKDIKQNIPPPPRHEVNECLVRPWRNPSKIPLNVGPLDQHRTLRMPNEDEVPHLPRKYQGF